MKTTLPLTFAWPTTPGLLSSLNPLSSRDGTFALPGAPGFLRRGALVAEVPRSRLCPRCERDRSLSRWWRAEWAAEERRAAPLARVSWGLMLAAGCISLLVAGRSGLGLVEHFPAFTAWVVRLLGGA